MAPTVGHADWCSSTSANDCRQPVRGRGSAYTLDVGRSCRRQDMQIVTKSSRRRSRFVLPRSYLAPLFCAASRASAATVSPTLNLPLSEAAPPTFSLSPGWGPRLGPAPGRRVHAASLVRRLLSCALLDARRARSQTKFRVAICLRTLLVCTVRAQWIVVSAKTVCERPHRQVDVLRVYDVSRPA
jgi:hypothetical protein